MSRKDEHHVGPVPHDKKGRRSNALMLAITLALLVAACITIAAVFQVLSTLNPGAKSQKKLEELGFSNIQLEPANKTMRAWVSVGSCRIHLERTVGIDENWHLFGESVVAGISGQATAEAIRNHPEFQECARKPASQASSSQRR